MRPLELGGDPARIANQSAVLEGGYPVAVPSGAGAKTAHASFLPIAGHAQRLGAGALRETRAEGRPDHMCEGLHSEFQPVMSSRLHTCVGFGRRQSNNAKGHVYAVGHKVWPKSPALAQLVRVHSLNNVPYLAWNLICRCVLGAYVPTLKSPKIDQNRPKSPNIPLSSAWNLRGTTVVRTWLGTLFKPILRF
jgi:hypothetical protein